MQIGADLDPDVRKLPIVLTETVDPANGGNPGVTIRKQAVEKALANRPDVKAANQRLDVDDLSIAAGEERPAAEPLADRRLPDAGPRRHVLPEIERVQQRRPASSILTSIPGGFSDALSQMFGFGYPVYSFGLTLNLPIRSHAAAMDMADAVVRKKSDALTLRNTQRAVRLSMLNGGQQSERRQRAVEAGKHRSGISPRRTWTPSRRSIELGTEINQNVINAQQALAAAESNVVQNQISLRRSMLNLLTQTGELLDQRGIVVQ